MPASQAKQVLSSLFRSTAKSSLSKSAEDITSSSSAPANCLIKFRKGKKYPLLKKPHNYSKSLSPQAFYSGGTLSSIAGLLDNPSPNVLENLSSSSISQGSFTLRRKEVSRGKKQKWVKKETQVRRHDRLVNTCAMKLGTSVFVDVFGRLGHETGEKEYDTLIGHCIKIMKTTENEKAILEQISNVQHLFMSMSKQGFQLKEIFYSQLLTFLIEMEMVEEFKLFCGVIQHENPDSLPRLAYYEMLLWIRLEDEDNIKDRCDYIANNVDTDNSNIRENYFLALCESERRNELLMLVDIIEITKISSMADLTTVFRSLARLLLESFAKKFILALKSCDIDAKNISKLIYDYAITMPNLAIQDVILKFKSLHEELDVIPASASYEKLIEHCCSLLKVHAALDIVDHMVETGLTVSLKMFSSILRACEESYDFNLVHRIYSLIHHNKLTPNNEIFQNMIYLSVRMKDFEGAYNMIKDMEKMSMIPTTSMYNVIMAAHFREKNFQAGLMVLNEMKRAPVKPDSQTFCYLILNCDREEDIIKYYEEVKLLPKFQITKHVFMALINAYASIGQLEKAKQVLLEKGIPGKNEVKSMLVSALASHGQISDAHSIYEEMKQDGCNAEPKTILYLIKHLQSEEKLSRLLDLLKDLKDTDYWIDGCWSVILYCVQCKDLRSTIDLLKQLNDKFYDDDSATEVIFDEAFCKIAEIEQEDMQFGLALLQSIKEELGVRPSRKILDFLLSACTSAKDLKSARLIWKEYETAGLPYNGLTYLRMYQALLACGDLQSAKKMKKNIPVDDPHVICVMKACEAAYIRPKKKKKEKKKKEI